MGKLGLQRRGCSSSGNFFGPVQITQLKYSIQSWKVDPASQIGTSHLNGFSSYWFVYYELLSTSERKSHYTLKHGVWKTALESEHHSGGGETAGMFVLRSSKRHLKEKRRTCLPSPFVTFV